MIRAVQVASDNSIFIAGATKSFNSNGWNAWLVKLDKDGDTIWQRNFNNSDAHALQLMPDGDIVISGYFGNTNDSQKAWVARLNSSGRLRWQWKFSAKSRANALQLSSDNGIIVAGHVRYKGSKTTKAWILKLNAFGNQTWKYNIKDVNGIAYSLYATSNGKLMATGNSKIFGVKQTWVLKLGD